MCCADAGAQAVDGDMLISHQEMNMLVCHSTRARAVPPGRQLALSNLFTLQTGRHRSDLLKCPIIGLLAGMLLGRVRPFVGQCDANEKSCISRGQPGALDWLLGCTLLPDVFAAYHQPRITTTRVFSLPC